MNMPKTAAAATALALLLSSPALAQATLVGTEALDDRIDDINRDVAEDLARGDDNARFGPFGVAQGFRGSIAATAAATSGNTDTGDLSLAGRLTYGAGAWTHSMGVAAEYGRDGGVDNKKDLFATYEANRYFSDRFYAFGIGRYQYDGFSSTEHDAFLGFGPGVRLVNTPNIAWRVQAGPGIRYTQLQNGSDQTQISGIASSRFYYKINDMLALTNDTDMLASEENILATNDLGLNFKMSERLTTRISYRTEYNSDPAPGFDDFDNTLGASLIVSF